MFGSLRFTVPFVSPRKLVSGVTCHRGTRDIFQLTHYLRYARHVTTSFVTLGASVSGVECNAVAWRVSSDRHVLPASDIVILHGSGSSVRQTSAKL